MKVPRLQPSWPLPDYVFIPGKHPHPKKVGGHMEGQKDPEADPIDLKHPQKCEFLRYGLDLYNHGYFWESHVYFESLWNAHHRTGSVADFLKGLIKMGAAGVKLAIEQKTSAIGHFDRARELFVAVKASEGEQFLGFDLTTLIKEIDVTLSVGGDRFFTLLPSWQ
jgi:hypothetical protein